MYLCVVGKSVRRVRAGQVLSEAEQTNTGEREHGTYTKTPSMNPMTRLPAGSSRSSFFPIASAYSAALGPTRPPVRVRRWLHLEMAVCVRVCVGVGGWTPSCRGTNPPASPMHSLIHEPRDAGTGVLGYLRAMKPPLALHLALDGGRVREAADSESEDHPPVELLDLAQPVLWGGIGGQGEWAKDGKEPQQHMRSTSTGGRSPLARHHARAARRALLLRRHALRHTELGAEVRELLRGEAQLVHEESVGQQLLHVS